MRAPSIFRLTRRLFIRPILGNVSNDFYEPDYSSCNRRDWRHTRDTFHCGCSERFKCFLLCSLLLLFANTHDAQRAHIGSNTHMELLTQVLFWCVALLVLLLSSCWARGLKLSKRMWGISPSNPPPISESHFTYCTLRCFLVWSGFVCRTCCLLLCSCWKGNCAQKCLNCAEKVTDWKSFDKEKKKNQAARFGI